MWTAGLKYSWKKMVAAAQNRTEMVGEEWSVVYVPAVTTRIKCRKSKFMQTL